MNIAVLAPRNTLSRGVNEFGNLRDSSTHVPALYTTTFAPKQTDSSTIPASAVETCRRAAGSYAKT